MKRCKITILQRTLNEELAREYAAPGFTKCPMMREGQVFYADYAKPEGFCDEAWKAVYQYVFALSHGAGKFYFGDWITKEGVAICSCNDGLRPVIMKIERTDQDSSIDYEPVRDHGRTIRVEIGCRSEFHVHGFLDIRDERVNHNVLTTRELQCIGETTPDRRRINTNFELEPRERRLEPGHEQAQLAL